jgi:signal transduction histidine kinase/CheY-like chemotaxis protein
MCVSLRRWLNDVPIRDPIARQQAALLQIMLVGLIITTTASMPLALIAPVEPEVTLLSLSASVLLILLTFTALTLLRRGRFNLSVATVTGGLLLALALLLTLGGLANSGALLLGFAIPIALAGLLASRRALLLTFGLSTLIVSLTAILEHLSPPLAGFVTPHDDITVITVGLFTLAAGLLGLFLDRFGAVLRDALTAALAREQELERVRAALETRSIELEREIGERAAELAERRTLEAQLLQAQKMESVGRLAGGVAHDFNNLLTAITGYADLALGALPHDAEARDDLGEIIKAAERACELVRQLLAFARKQIIEPRILNLNDLIDEIDNLLRRLIGADIELTIRPAPDLGSIKADPSQIEQVLINLAVNARDAMPDGGKLTIETTNVVLDDQRAQQHLDVTTGPYVLLTISDTGIGMTEAIKQQIFEPFFTTKGLGKGTGLGMATCYGIIKQHGGHIEVYSEPQQGATFNIYLPRVEADDAVSTRRRPALEQLPRGTETVLLAEDELAVRALAGRVLRAQGYSVLEAADGEVALNLARSREGLRIDLLLTDVVMPRMGGKTLAEQIVSMYPGIKVLFTSGYTDDTIVHFGRLDPGVAFIQKPFSPSALAHKVRDVLDS